MIDFIEYVVSELKSKRLSKQNAIKLIEQYSLHSSITTKTSIIHPLLHCNISDLNQQSYRSDFSGKEFFLRDHQVKGQKVLPGVAYLEMARAAVEKAMPFQPESTIMELHNVVWAQPIIVKEVKEVTIALFANDDEISNGQIDFEIYSIGVDTEDNPKETIHCQGQAVFVNKPTAVKLDIAQLKEKTQQGQLESKDIYTAYAKLGLNYGLGHQGIQTIYQGDKQLLAQLNLPEVVESTQNEYVLHPSLMDSALQSAIGFFADLNQIPNRPSLPFALESLSIFSTCTKEMFAWVRYSSGSQSNAKVTKLDVDLCDQEGNLCVQMQGFSSRVLSADINVVGEQEKRVDAILATPVWQTSTITASSNAVKSEYTQQYIVLCEMSKVNFKQFETIVPHSHCLLLKATSKKNIAERYSEATLACFELIQKILKSKPKDKVLVQIVTAYNQKESFFAGLSGLIKTAALENPQLIGQIILTEPQILAEDLVMQLKQDQTRPHDTIIKYEQGIRQVLRLEEILIGQDKPVIAFKDQGVYLITGGLGGLGLLFVKEIIKQTKNAKIILTDRVELTAKKQAILDELRVHANQLIYQQLDITNLEQTKQFIEAINKENKQINGILHCAGMIADNFILKKTPEEISQVLAPKVTGTFNLDEASKDIDLDFLVLFSSISAMTGNNGQADYATANGFMDQFVSYRNQLVAANQRQGKTVSINWPLWLEGGMMIDPSSLEMIRQSTGMHPMRTETGMQAFYRSLELQQGHTLVVEGDLLQLRHTLFALQTVQSIPSPIPTPVQPQVERPNVVEIDAGNLEEKTQDYIKKQLSELLKLPFHKIDSQAPLEKYGIDSILAMKLTNQLEKTFGSLPKTLFFEYQTIRELTDYFIKAHSATLASLFAIVDNDQTPVQPQVERPNVVEIDAGNLEEKTQDYIKKQLSELLKLPFHRIDSQAPLEKYGIDSILAMKLTNQLEKTFGSLPKTLFFEYQTIRELTDYFIKAHSATLASLFAIVDNDQKELINKSPEILPLTQVKQIPSRPIRRQRHVSVSTNKANSINADPIAIIGLSGCYPEASNIEEYWRNLRDGKDCIIEVPKDRWDWREYYSEDRSKSGYHYSKWGGFIAGVDEFDPLFFNISPIEAEMLDPQERLFLQHAWMAIEDAGYTRASLQIPHEKDMAGQVGVYAGVMYSEYQLLGVQASMKGKRIGVPGSYASIANRVSYVLNLHGPSMTLDSMCSSSLTAIHLACQDLKEGRTSLGIAGGVNVSIHPNKYLVISAGQFISSDGHCQSFGEGSEGYIPGEGVGVVILKRFSEAVRDGNHIYGIIKGSALNHGGKTNGYSVPNPQAQASVISRVLVESNTDPRHISYIEAHGTGTKLGDPIEIAALSQAFQRHTQDVGFCLIGSAKSNIGHCESAAGIAGLTKVLLQLKHQQIVPSLHSTRLNPHIDFQKTPFVVNQTLRTWDQPVIDGCPQPRIAGISSFGAGGSNTHIIIQEHVTPTETNPIVEPNTKFIIPLSARTIGQLKQKTFDLLDFIRTPKADENIPQSIKSIDLAAMAYTLQVGREAMDERLGFMVSSVDQLAEKLQAYINGEQNIEDVYQGRVEQDNDTLSLFNVDTDFQQTIDKWIAKRKLSKLLDLWAKGLNLDWNKLYGDDKPKFISLPLYPFAKERFWIDTKMDEQTEATGKTTTVLHPLLHSNTSDFNRQSYSSTFNGSEFFLMDHQVKMDDESSHKILPAVAYLEMTRVALEKATPSQQELGILELRNTIWAQPLVVKENKQVTIALLIKNSDQVDYEICSQNNGQEIIHCQGQAGFSHQPIPNKLDIEQLKGQMGKGRLEGTSLYPVFSTMGLNYGPAYQGVKVIYQGEKQVLAQLSLPTIVEAGQSDYLMHPSLMDSALQAAIGLIKDLTQLPAKPSIPFALESIRIISASTQEMFAWVRYSQGSNSEDLVTKLDIDLCDQEGNVCVQMQGFSSRVITTDVIEVQNKGVGTLLATPLWESGTSVENPLEYAQQHIILCGMPQVKANQLEAIIPKSQSIQLQSSQKNIAGRYGETALACFELIQTVFKDKPHGMVLAQIVIANNNEEALFAGLSGLLKTATMENPQLIGQIILTEPNIGTEVLARQLREVKSRPQDMLTKFEQGTRSVLKWKEIEVKQEKSEFKFKDQGVYLITGGLGGLGVLFTKEIFKHTSNATVIITGRSELTVEIQNTLSKFPVGMGRLIYKQVDITILDQVKQLFSTIIEENKHLNGIIHSAGMILDSFILKKTSLEFCNVLAPKVTGTFNLDEASKDINLDFLVLFSSVTGAMGNLGQADYAAANGFMDQFSFYRNRLVDKKLRHGRTLSINWPLWQEGGMHIDTTSKDMLHQVTGILPMQTSTGIQAFYQSLSLQYSQTMVMEGYVTKMRSILLEDQSNKAVLAQVVTGTMKTASVSVPETDSNILVEKTKDYLCKQFSTLLKLPAHEIEPKAPLEKYGIDSILAMKLTNKLEETFGSLSKTLFFEYQTIASLAGFFVKTYPHIVQEKIGVKQVVLKAKEPDQVTIAKGSIASTVSTRNRFLTSKPNNTQVEIAIVGIGGKYPQAENLEEFWENLKNGRDCITEIPIERWDNKLYFNPERNQAGKSYSKWGGFISDVDKFDPLFFNISPKEAELTDPQERLFIETVWQTIEDAGYSKEGISAVGRVGVYVGVMYGQYQLYGAEAMLAGNTNVPGSSYASIANRVSYFFNFNGPSIALDTMCSSSLTAIHLACEEIRKGDIDAAIAGGVNVSIHPHKYLLLSQGNFAASDGKCRSFGEGGDGYVAGEGVGAILLKSLEKAIQDGDHIYGVIKSSVINHGGKTNGYSVPNPNAQGDLILEALKKAKIDPTTLSYIETHGTGTSLGDPIEITGLRKAFEGFTQKKQFCSIGSVKSNIGHLESAAGIAAVTKALLQIKHGQLVPSLHADPLNPNINFNESPFYVQKELVKWEHPAGYPRRVGVSSFGAGGSNAHLIIEEYTDIKEAEDRSINVMPRVFVLSAKNQIGLLRYAEKIVDFIRNNSNISLADMVYTSQLGRTPMNERLVIVTSSLEELEDKLNKWLVLRKGSDSRLKGRNSSELEGVYDGNIKDAQSNTGNLIEGEAGRAFLKVIVDNGDLEKLAKLWISGVDIDWSLLYQNAYPRRVSLPTYPFAKERYWINAPSLNNLANQKSINKINIETAKEVVEQRSKMNYYPQWSVTTLTNLKEKSLANEPILILDTAEELYLTLKKQLGGGLDEKSLILVKLEHNYKNIEQNIYSINPEQEEHFYQLVENLKGRNQLPLRIIHHCSETDNLKSEEEIARQLNYGLYTIFYLCKALMRQQYQTPLQILSVFSNGINRTAPQNAALGGFYKTLSLENPKFLTKVIEIQDDLNDSKKSLSEKVNLIIDEFSDKDWTKNEICYKFQNEKYIRHVKELALFTSKKDKITELPLKQNGVYIVSGGLGGLGFIFSEYLVKNLHCKLVLFGRSALKADQEAKLNQLKAYKTEIIYVQADASKLEDIEEVVRTAKTHFSQINGVIHSAGINKDSFILKKTKEEMEKVLESKVYGTINLDKATQEEKLDVFILFSSIAGVIGNLGQCDYAYANHFIDSFAENRENLRKEQKRFGKTVSINWPYWEEGGMTLSQNEIELIAKQTGICPLPTKIGIQCWEEILRSDLSQGIVLYGVSSKVDAYITQKPIKSVKSQHVQVEAVNADTLLEQTIAYLKDVVSNEIKLPIDRIDSQERFEFYGIDSMMINRMNAKIEKDLGALPKTLFYEYETIAELAKYLAQESRQALYIYFNLEISTIESEIHTVIEDDTEKNQKIAQIQKKYEDSEPIAVIGVHGHYPHSEDLNEFWENLKRGKDLIDLVPASRWNYEEFYHQDPEKAAEGKIYCKWGGFINDVDKFDTLFFNIPAEEAKIMDPQERLFLESVWASIEDAGYTKDSLKERHPKAKSADVGVFVGVTTNSYNLLAAEEWSRGNMVSPSALPWSIANRVSYFFDFQGPSMPVDTACSSSLVAIHLACESLKRQECQVAIAGGVNLYLHPSKYHSLCKRRMVSVGGKCRSYGVGDDGFVPGEGVGSIFLKPLSKAIADQDHIYAVIAGSAFDHSGRSNGYSAPNPNSQANLIEYTLSKAHINPESISYIEGHGTGTQLGDSLEISALTNAFQKQTKKKQFCPVGSVKANIGHSESAAGIAGVTKILLQMKHQQLVPSIYSEVANPNIDFNNSPFYLQHKLTPWQSSSNHPRRALINSFGAGGVNACVILEEYKKENVSEKFQEAGLFLVILSAKNEERLREYANRLLSYLGNEKNVNLANLSYTLQVGRESMPERLAIITSNRSELIDQLKDWRQQKLSANIYQGKLDPRKGGKKSIKKDEEDLFRTIVETNDLTRLAEMWITGTEIDWEKLYPQTKPIRITIPTYPFAKERYWVSNALVSETTTTTNQKNAQLHPLVSYNSSTMKEVSFSSLLSDNEFYALDHKVNEEKIFPGSGFLEIACISGNMAGEQKVNKIRDIVWIQPLSFRIGSRVLQTSLKQIGSNIEYQITSLDDDNEKIVHSEGKLYFQNNGKHSPDIEKSISIQKLKEQCPKPQVGNHYYDLFKKVGFNYGPTFQTIQELYINNSFALSKLKISDHSKVDFDQFILHPSIIDGALQTVASLVSGLELTTPYLPFAIDEVEIIRPMPQTCYAYVEFADSEKQVHADIMKFNIQLLNEGGDTLVRLKNFYVRALNKS
ncbi:MAG: SDR family NAD(P)-dependent oxidoreductase [Bacteroidales bacterium]|nr:SDR family NAD(P)-dependent oxidoreductase [Bacteroidales bacterium]